MQDPEIQNILSDPVMRQVSSEKLLVQLCSTCNGDHIWILVVCMFTEKELGWQVLIDFQENPKAAQEHTKNPMVMNKIQKLVTAGIIQIR